MPQENQNKPDSCILRLYQLLHKLFSKGRSVSFTSVKLPIISPANLSNLPLRFN